MKLFGIFLYHLDSPSVEVGHAQATLSNWVTLEIKSQKVNKNRITTSLTFIQAIKMCHTWEKLLILTKSEAFLKYCRAVSLFWGRKSLPSEYIWRTKRSMSLSFFFYNTKACKAIPEYFSTHYPYSKPSNCRPRLEFHSLCRGKPWRACCLRWQPGWSSRTPSGVQGGAKNMWCWANQFQEINGSRLEREIGQMVTWWFCSTPLPPWRCSWPRPTCKQLFHLSFIYYYYTITHFFLKVSSIFFLTCACTSPFSARNW